MNQLQLAEYSRLLDSEAVFTKFVKALAKHERVETDLMSWDSFNDLPDILKQVYNDLISSETSTSATKNETLSHACESLDAAFGAILTPTRAPVSEEPTINVPVIRSEEKGDTTQPSRPERSSITQSPTVINVGSDAPVLQREGAGSESDSASQEPLPSFAAATSVGKSYSMPDLWKATFIAAIPLALSFL